MLDLDLDNPSYRELNLVGVLLLLLLFRMFLLSFFDIINLSRPIHHMYHPTHHAHIYKYSVPVKEAFDLNNHSVTPTDIYVWFSRQRQRDSEAAAAEAAETAIFTLWYVLKSPPPPSSNATKSPTPSLELLAIAPVTPTMIFPVVVVKDDALDTFPKYMDQDATEKVMNKR